MYRAAADKPKYVTSDDLVLSDAEYYQKRSLMNKNWHVPYVFIITALVKLPWQCLGVPNFGNVKLSSAEGCFGAWGLLQNQVLLNNM